MKITLLALVTVTLALAPVGCGGDGSDGEDAARNELSFEAYFERIENVGEAVLGDVDPECLDLDPAFGLDFEGSWEEYRDESLRFNRCLFDIGQRHVAYLDSLDPPREAAAAHDRWVEAKRAFWADMEAQMREIEAARSEEELLAASAGILDNQQLAAEDVACNELQRIARDHGTRVDLLCNEE